MDLFIYYRASKMKDMSVDLLNIALCSKKL